LTASEARLAALIGNGETIDAATSLLGLTRETVRRRLKTIFVKADVTRQAEPVTLFGRLPKRSDE
jgi:DNA-binding CsgD family transcriptional regulator